jgi:DNA-binding MarR family transcriptional regulator
MSLPEKWSPWEYLGDRPYLQVPHGVVSLLASKGFSSASILVVLGMVSKIRQETGCLVRISQKRLGEYSGVAIKTVFRALKEMEKNGMKQISCGLPDKEAASYDLTGFFVFLKKALVDFDKEASNG